MECLTPNDAATRIHVEDQGGAWAVWLDTDVDEHDGLVIGFGVDRAAAIRDAIIELQERLADLERRA